MTLSRCLWGVCRLIVLVSVVAAPWFLAAIDEVTQHRLGVAMLVALVALVLARLAGASLQVPAPVVIVLLGSLLLGGLQTTPLPHGLVSVFSPHAAKLHQRLLPQSASADASLGQAVGLPTAVAWRTTSLYPARSRYQLSLLVVAVTTFYLASQVFNTGTSRAWLLGSVATSGAVLGFFGIIQKLAWNGRVFWIGPTLDGTPFATFVNRNNAGGYLNLTLSAGLGLAIWAVTRGVPLVVTSSSGAPTSVAAKTMSRVFHRRRSSWALDDGNGGFWRNVVVGLDPAKLGLAWLCVVMMGAVFCTLSRGAGLALLGALTVTMLAMAATKRVRPSLAGWFVTAAIAGVGLVAWAGLADALQVRFGTLADTDKLISDGRVPNWIDALRGVPDFWPSGSGIGTYAYVYQMYQEWFDWGWYFHAENQYLEALFEAGIPGLLLMLTAIVLVARSCWQILSRVQHGESLALGVAGCFAIVSQCLHAWFDFGLYVPANMLLMATLCGVVCGRARELVAADNGRTQTQRWLRAKLVVVVPGLLTIATCWAVFELRAYSHSMSCTEQATYSQTPAGATTDELRAAIEVLRPIAGERPDDYRLQTRLAKLWTHQYRIAKLHQLRLETATDVSLDTLWEQTSPQALHEQIYDAMRRGSLTEAEELRNDELVREFLLPSLRRLIQARDGLPVRAIAHVRVASLCLLVSEPNSDIVHLDRARLCDPAFVDVLFQVGQLHCQAGRIDQACESWRRTLELDWSYCDTVLDLAASQLSSTAIVNQMLPEEPIRLLELAESRFAPSDSTEIRQLLLARTSNLLRRVDLPIAEQYYWLGRVAAARQRKMQAIRYLAMAVRQRPTQLDWRFQLAEKLQENQMWEQALLQADRCAREAPKEPTYRRLVEAIKRQMSIDAAGD